MAGWVGGWGGGGAAYVAFVFCLLVIHGADVTRVRVRHAEWLGDAECRLG